MSDEMEKEWNEFVNGNRELICGFEDALVMAFNAGWFAGKQEAVRLASESVDMEWLPAILADYYDWLEGVKGQTYVVKKGDEKFPPRIKTALMFLRGTKFWAEKEAKKNE